jgi:glutaredoxin
MNKITEKIINNSNKYIVFYTTTCIYCINTLKLLRRYKLPYKAYDIDKMKGGMEKLLSQLRKGKDLTGYNIKHITRPIIFKYGKFLGGYTDLVADVQK